MTYDELSNQSSFEIWFPVVENVCEIPTPRSTIVLLEPDEIRAFYDEVVSKTVVKRVHEAANSYGYPFFLRTDQASGKHSWKKSCFVPNAESISSHIYEVVMFNLLADIMGLPFKSLIVREYIELESAFTAFWGDMPVAKERRYFVRDGVVECRHEYWVEGAIRQGMEHKSLRESEWLEQLRALNHQSKNELRRLTRYASSVGKELGGYWSVDFAKAKDGRWLLIDMARGEISYHVDSCPHAEGTKPC